jgi:hypothetical protein
LFGHSTSVDQSSAALAIPAVCISLPNSPAVQLGITGGCSTWSSGFLAAGVFGTAENMYLYMFFDFSFWPQKRLGRTWNNWMHVKPNMYN